MIYQQTSIIINSDIEKSWNVLQKTMTSGENFSVFNSCFSIDVISEIEGQIKRVLNFTDRVEEEIVTVSFQNYRITVTITNNGSYCGEVSYNLLKPSDPFLSEKQCSLLIISAWRMVPGVFAAPLIDKQEYINSISTNLKAEIEIS